MGGIHFKKWWDHEKYVLPWKVNANGVRAKKQKKRASHTKVRVDLTLHHARVTLHPCSQEQTLLSIHGHWRCYITPQIQVPLGLTERSLILQDQIRQVTCIICDGSGIVKPHQSSPGCGTRLFEVQLLLSLSFFWWSIKFFISVRPEFQSPPHPKKYVCTNVWILIFFLSCGTTCVSVLKFTCWSWNLKLKV